MWTWSKGQNWTWSKKGLDLVQPCDVYISTGLYLGTRDFIMLQAIR